MMRRVMLDALFGNASAAKTLIYVAANREAYAQELADRFGVSLSMVQNQLKRLADGGVLVSVTRGRTRLYALNPRFGVARELETLLRRTFELLPERERERYIARRRPRAPGKRLGTAAR